MKKKTTLIALVLTMALGLTACTSKPAADPSTTPDAPKTPAAQTTNLSFASGGTSGTYYPYASTVAQTWQKHIDGLSVNVQATGASAENINLISKGEVDVAIVQNDVMKYAYDGIETFAGEGKATQNFATMATVYSEVCQIIASPKANIQSVADLKGKRVSVGDIGSGVESNAKQILAAYGLTFDDIKVQNLGFGDSASAIKDGTLDAVFITAGIPTTAVLELASTSDIDVVGIDKETIDKLKSDYNYYADYTITKDAYKGMEADVMTVAVKATLIVRPDLDEEIVYQMTKALFENKEEITQGHNKGVELDVNEAVEGVSVPFHPGAERYFKEVGVIK